MSKKPKPKLVWYRISAEYLILTLDNAKMKDAETNSSHLLKTCFAASKKKMLHYPRSL